MIIALAILALVTGLVLYAIFKFRARPDAPEPKPVFGHLRLEIGWTAGALFIVAVLLALVAITMGKADPALGVAANQPPDMIIIGHQWWWEARYSSGVVVANEIHIPVGKPMLAQLNSNDVIHDLWVPQLSRKMDMTPGSTTRLILSADTPGVYQGACAEYCGVEHAWMRLQVVAQSQGDFNAWLQGQSKPPPLPTSGPYAQAVQIFQQRNCASCHKLGQLGKAVGPDLSHVGSRQTLAGGILQNTPDNLAKWLRDPQAVKPGVYMPNLRLTDQEIASLVAYLESLK